MHNKKTQTTTIMPYKYIFVLSAKRAAKIAAL